jgi:hypothetical protein
MTRAITALFLSLLRCLGAYFEARVCNCPVRHRIELLKLLAPGTFFALGGLAITTISGLVVQLPPVLMPVLFHLMRDRKPVPVAERPA